LRVYTSLLGSRRGGVELQSPRTTNTIMCFNGKPDVQGLVYDAQFICNSRGQKYGIVCGAVAKGLGVPHDYKEAVSRIREAAKRGNAEAQNNLGVMYEKGLGVPQDYAQAISWFREAAKRGNAEAQNNLGVMYEGGLGVPQDDAQAVSWYREAAEQGNAEAQNHLGGMYADGRGVPQDYAQAASWYRKAAEQDDVDAQFWLGFLYERGLGVPQDSIIACALYNLSAAGDPSSDNRATNNRSRLAEKMTPQQIAAGQELTRRMMKIGVLKAIDAIHPGSRAR
jgi:TPR repeat protein